MITSKQRYTNHYLFDVLQWDVYTWKKALYYWDMVLSEWISSRSLGDAQVLGEIQAAGEVQTVGDMQAVAEIRALDIGARDGGLSLYLANKGIRVTCTDLHGPSEQAREMHHRYEVQDLVEYAEVDATSMPFDDESFDLVVFKSMLGAVGQSLGIPAVDRVIAEVRRVLKPGGMVLFAENQEGSRFHQWARPRFMPWGATYYYLPQSEIKRLFSNFEGFGFQAYGFTACAKKDFLPLAILDRIICLTKQSKRYYMVFGHALK